MVLNNAGVITGGEISADKYNVFEGDKVTFTFTSDIEDFIVIDFEINGKAVDLDPTASSYTYTVEQVEAVQVTSCVFTTVESYGKDLVLDAYKALTDADKELATITNGAVSTTEETGRMVTDLATSEIAEKALEAVEAVGDAYDDLDSTLTVKEKLSALETAAKAEIAKVDAAYESALTKAKTDAVTTVTSLINNLKSGTKSEGDYQGTSDLASAKAVIEAATTLKGVAEAVSASKSSTSWTGGKYNNLIALKEQAYDEVNKALNAVLAEVPALKSSSSKEYKNLVSDLKDLGIEISALPTEIAKTYYAKIEEATSIKRDAYGHTDVGYEGYVAIGDSLDSLKEEIKDKVLANYIAEVNASEVLANNSERKSQLIGALKSSAEYWFTLATGTNHEGKFLDLDQTLKADPSLSAFYKLSDTAISNPQEKAVTLMDVLEAVLTTSKHADANFSAERLATIRDEEAAKIAKVATDILAKDTLYASLTDYVTASDYTMYADSRYSEINLGYKDSSSKDVTVDNPFLTYDKESTNTKIISGRTAYEVKGFTSVTVDDVTYPLESGSDHSYLIGEYAGYATYAYGKTGVYSTSLSTAQQIKAISSKYQAGVKAIYAAALKYYESSFKASSSDTTGTGIHGLVGGSASYITEGTYVSNQKIEDIWNASVYGTESDGITPKDRTGAVKSSVTMTTINTLAANVKGMASLLTSLDKSVLSWMQPKKTYGSGETDLPFVELFNEGTSNESTMRASLDTLISDVLNGKKGESDIKAFVATSNLDALYEAEVSGYLEKAKVALDRYVTNLQVSATPAVSSRIEKAHTKWLGLIGRKDTTKAESDTNGYDVDTISNVNEWLNLAENAAYGVEGQSASATTPVEALTNFSSDAVKYCETLLKTAETETGVGFKNSEGLTISYDDETSTFKVSGDAVAMSDAQLSWFRGKGNEASHKGESVFVLNLPGLSQFGATTVTVSKSTAKDSGYDAGKTFGNGTGYDESHTWDKAKPTTFIYSVAQGESVTNPFVKVEYKDKDGNVVATFIFDLSELKPAKAVTGGTGE